MSVIKHFFRLRSKVIPATVAREDTAYHRKNTIQINRVRTYIRKQKYLEDPFTKEQHVSMDGKNILHQDLVNFSTTSQENLSQYIQVRLKGERDFKVQPIYVTLEEYEDANKVENLTKEQLKVKIFELIENIHSEDALFHEESFQKSIKNGSKQKYIDFFYELCEVQDDEEELPQDHQ